MPSEFRTLFPPLHREGIRFVAIAAVATAGLFWLAQPLGWVGLVFTLWVAYFFRDPPRVTPNRLGLVVSPADGVVQSIEEAIPPVELDLGAEPRWRIAVFMNVFNVHVNRVPAAGEIVQLSYRAGAFFNAASDKASTANERQAIRMRTTEGKDIAIVQIAGLIARRILCTLVERQQVRAGERLGMIRFGSRVDVYLDRGMVPLVLVGQRAVAGETVLADSRSDEGLRQGDSQ
ncbi:MAG: phosphatidylserine decarboxylase [Alphaproteobacteria bacterium]|nr:phosphatidylserine decarboxylase [Alphaproteobacteria bacterium]